MRSTEHLPAGTPSAWSLRSRHSSRQRSGAGDRGRSVKIMRHYLFIICLILIATFDLHADQVVRDGVISTSLVRVVSNPERYTGKRILLRGYLKIAFEESGLYLSKDDSRILNTKQALWIGGPKQGLKIKYPSKGYVMIVGTLRYNPKTEGYGHLGLWLAELDDIEQILPER